VVKVAISGLGDWITIWSRFGLAGRVLQAEQGEGAEAGAVPGEIAAGGGVVAVTGAVEDAGDDVAGGGEQPGRLPGAQPGGVFAETDVAPVIDWSSHCSFTVGGWLEQAVLASG
jgi:hypothetical protein